MANFLRGIGYATPAINMTARTMLDYAKEMRNAPLREAESQARVAESEQRRAVSEETLSQLKAQGEEEKRLREERTKPINAKAAFHGVLSRMSPSKQEEWLKWATDSGGVDENGNTNMERLEKMQKTLLMDTTLTKKFQSDTREFLSKQIEDIDSKIDSLREDPDHDRKKMDTLVAQRKQLLSEGSEQESRWEKLGKMQQGYELFRALEKSGKMTPELKAIAMTAMQTGEGIDEALEVLKAAGKETGKAETKPITPYQEKYLKTKNRELTLKEKELEYKGKVVGKKEKVKEGEPGKREVKQATASQQLKEFNKYLDMHYGSIEGVDPKNIYGSLSAPMKKRYMDILAKGKKYLSKGVDPLEAFNKAKGEVFGKPKNPQSAPKSQVLVFDPATGEFKEK